MPGVAFDSSASTSLIQQYIGADGQFFEFCDTASGGLLRYRSVYVDQDPDLVLVFDRASGASSYQQVWHLDPGLTVTTVTRSYAGRHRPGHPASSRSRCRASRSRRARPRWSASRSTRTRAGCRTRSCR